MTLFIYIDFYIIQVTQKVSSGELWYDGVERDDADDEYKTMVERKLGTGNFLRFMLQKVQLNPAQIISVFNKIDQEKGSLKDLDNLCLMEKVKSNFKSLSDTD